MTDRVNGLFVALDSDIREDDVQELISAIRLLRNVADVTTNISDPMGVIGMSRLRLEFARHCSDFFAGNKPRGLSDDRR